ncbi:F-box/RNI-like/FBD-like domains-containing protein [Euphorbia peplus]|nr:F-box/RNI-like/FBD-like domains-containing protein [Euphorbia peplus]
METDSNFDRISDLPSNVIDIILAFLTFKEAVRTSTLSKNWKHKWHTLPNIIIGKDMYTDEETRLEGMINYILTLHRGRIQKFSVLVEVEDSYNLKSWIWRLEKKGIQEFFLIYRRRRRGYPKEIPNEMPCILFSCQQLRKLSLQDCALNLARSYTGFQSLISLEFNKVDMEIDAFENLISSCPLLEQLTLKKFHYFADLHINVPKLKYLCVEGEFLSVFLNTPFLEIFSIDVYRYRMEECYYYHNNRSSLRFKICGLPSTIKELYVQCEFEKYLDACDTFIYSHLRTLGLDQFCFDEVEQVLCLLSLIGSSDNLTTLDITARCRREAVSETITKFWEEQNGVPLMLNKLRKVRVGSFQGNDPEMKLIQYVMTNSPALEELTVEYIKEHKFNKDEVKGILQLLCKSSTQLSFMAQKHDSQKRDDDFSYFARSDQSYEDDSD